MVDYVYWLYSPYKNTVIMTEGALTVRLYWKQYCRAHSLCATRDNNLGTATAVATAWNGRLQGHNLQKRTQLLRHFVASGLIRFF